MATRLICLLVLSASCVRPPQASSAPTAAADPARIVVDFDWGPDNDAERAFAAELLEAKPSAPTTSPRALLIAFDALVERWLEEGRLAELGSSGEIDWYRSAWDWGDGELLHVHFELDQRRGRVTQLLEVTRPEGLSVRARVLMPDTRQPTFDPGEIQVTSFDGVELALDDMLPNAERIATARLHLGGPIGERRAVYSAALRDDPSFLVFSFKIPQDIDAQQRELEQWLESFDSSHDWIFSDPADDLLALFQQISIVRSGQSPEARLERLLEVLLAAHEYELLTAVGALDFPGGVELRVEEESYSKPVVRVELRGATMRLRYLTRELEVIYDSGDVEAAFVSKARNVDRFNFGTWLPDWWRDDAEEIFVRVYRMNRARSLAYAIDPPPSEVVQQTLTDLKGIGVYLDHVPVRINAIAYELHIAEEDIATFLAALGRASPARPTLPGLAPLPGRGMVDWGLGRYTEGGMQFVRDGTFLYYQVTDADLRGGVGLSGIRAKLAALDRERFGHRMSFSGFSDRHLAPGMLLPIPRPKEHRALSSAELRRLIGTACASESYDYPELVYAIIWNESQAGIDNFFRFEVGRLDAVQRLRKSLKGEARASFEEIYGRFGYLLAGSYGPGHILYENAWAMGFRGSPGEFAKPDVNIRYIVRFLQRNGIDRSSSLAEISRKYNGPAYKRNRYAQKLEKNLARGKRVFAKPS